MESHIRQSLRDVIESLDGRPYGLACSGGLDSLLMIDLAAEFPAAGCVLHLDHGLRSESARDRDFVNSEAQARGLTCHSERVDLSGHPGSLETRARQARYEFFACMAERFGLAGVILAHHADDQVETVALELLRGGGPLALRGMMAERALRFGSGTKILRPWLSYQRNELATLARSRGLTWREDPSNRDCRLGRNRLRHETLPAARRQSKGNLDFQILELHEHAMRLETKSQSLAAKLMAPWLEAKRVAPFALGAREVSIPKADLQNLPAELQRMILGKLGRSLGEVSFDPSGRQSKVWLEQAMLAGSTVSLSPQLQLGPGHAKGQIRLIRQADAYESLRRAATSWDPRTLALGEELTIVETGERFQLSHQEVFRPAQSETNSAQQVIPLHGRSHLRLRRVEPGEKFRPFGWAQSGHRKLVAEAMADAGIASDRRQMMAVVADAESNELLWIPGVRAAEGARCAEGESCCRIDHLTAD